MLSSNTEALPVFCDWLDVTTPPDREYALRSALGPIICGSGGSKLKDDLYELGNGKIKIGFMWYLPCFYLRRVHSCPLYSGPLGNATR